MVQRIVSGLPHPLFDTDGVRVIERAAMATLPSHTLMQRAGLAVARLGMAVAPHAGRVWIAAGPGNNGGDGLEAAVHLARCGREVTITWLGDAASAPADARASLQRAQAAGVRFAPQAPQLAPQDLAIDALLGIGAARPPSPPMADCIGELNGCGAVLLAVDLPTGLLASTGALTSGRGARAQVRADHTLSLLVLKPGLFTAEGRDHAGQIWLDGLDCRTGAAVPRAWLNVPGPHRVRPHASHKGSYGDVAVLGGAQGMAGAAILAARAALHGGAGRVFVGLLQDQATRAQADAVAPELMFRDPGMLALDRMTVVCGCGGGTAVKPVLPGVLRQAQHLVLDADGLNAVADDPALQELLRARAQPTVLTPHPLEAARLLGCSAAEVQADRLATATALARELGCTVALKGSGTVIAAPGQVPRINPTGNARLATAGTGDVLAGMVGAALARGQDPWQAACSAVYAHGAIADAWPDGAPALTAAALAAAAPP